MDPQKQEAFWRLWHGQIELAFTSSREVSRDILRNEADFPPMIMQIVADCAAQRQPIPNDQLSDRQLFCLFTLFYDCFGTLNPCLGYDMRHEMSFMAALIFRDGLSIRGFKHILSHDSQAEFNAGLEKWRTAGGDTNEGLRTTEGRKDLFWHVWIERILTRLQTTDSMWLTEAQRRYVAETVTARKPLNPHLAGDRTLGDTYSLTCQQAFKGMCTKTHGIEYYDWIEIFKPEVLDLSD